MVSDGETSRYEVAAELLKILKLDDEINLIQVNSEYFKDEFFAERPASERLINRKLNLRNMNSMRPWQISLEEYINKYYMDFLDE